jgi:hypothetical protein
MKVTIVVLIWKFDYKGQRERPYSEFIPAKTENHLKTAIKGSLSDTLDLKQRQAVIQLEEP